MKKLLFFLLIAVAFTSCTIVPFRNTNQLTKVESVDNSINTLFTSISEGANTYTENEHEYNFLSNEIDSLVSINSTRSKAKILLGQTIELQREFAEAKNYHKEKGILPASEARIYRSFFKSLIRPILVSEKSLK